MILDQFSWSSTAWFQSKLTLFHLPDPRASFPPKKSKRRFFTVYPYSKSTPPHIRNTQENSSPQFLPGIVYLGPGFVQWSVVLYYTFLSGSSCRLVSIRVFVCDHPNDFLFIRLYSIVWLIARFCVIVCICWFYAILFVRNWALLYDKNLYVWVLVCVCTLKHRMGDFNNYSDNNYLHSDYNIRRVISWDWPCG